jgi:uncharacterized delta-60 repeat protein
MWNKIHPRLLLIFALSVVALVALPTRAAPNNGLDSSFGGFGAGGVVADAPLSINALALLPNGKIVVVGVQNSTFAVARYLPSGALDGSFGTGGLLVTPLADGQRAEATSIVVQPDGKLVVVGTVYGPSGNDFAVLRYEANGALDTSFIGDGKLVVDFDGGDDRAAAVALDRDGRIVVGGSAGAGSQARFAALRLTASGTLDATFDGNGKATVDFGGAAVARDLLLQPKGEIVLVGRATVVGKDGVVRTREALARLTPNGARDTTWDKDGLLVSETVGDAVGSSAALAGDNKLVVVGGNAEGGFLVARYNPDGTPDTSLGGDGTVSTPFGSPDTVAHAVLALPDGTLLVAGQSAEQMAFARYKPDGALDQSFAGDGTLLLPIAQLDSTAAFGVALAADGRLLAAGERALTRLWANGALDAGGRQLVGFGPGIVGEATTTLAQSDGKLVSVGTVVQVGVGVSLALARHQPDGQLDPLFGNGGTRTLGRSNSALQATDALLQPQDGKLLVVGSIGQQGKQHRDLLVARFNADGSPDTTCGDAGLASIDLTLDEEAHAVALQADNKILVAGTIPNGERNRAFVLRLETNCVLPDSTFGDGGLVMLPAASSVVDLFALPQGQVQFVGAVSNGGVFLARLRSSDGGPDDSFGSPGAGGKVLTPLKDGAAQVATLLPDGKLLVGAAQSSAGQATTLLLRYTDNGELDPGWGKEGVVANGFGSNGALTALALRGDGAFALAGCHGDTGSAPVALFDPAGTPDPAFGDGGKADLMLGSFTCLRDAVWSGERLLVGGFAQDGANETFALAAYTTDQPRILGFDPPQGTLGEAAGVARLTVQLRQTAAQTVTVQYAATGGSATNGADYTLPAGALTFAPGQTVQHIRVPLTNDTSDETDETIVVALSNPGNAVLGSNASFTLTIADDDGPTTTPAPPTPPGAGKGVFLPLVRR